MTSRPALLRWLSRDRMLWVAAAVVLAARVVVSVLTPQNGQVMVDFQVYRGADLAWFESGGLYTFQGPTGLPFTYPPFAAILLAPFAVIGQWPGIILFFAAEFACFAALVRFTFNRAAARFGEALPGWSPGLMAVVFSVTAPAQTNFNLGQVSVMVIAASVTPFIAKDAYRNGVLCGFATAVKLLPGVFVLLAWLARRRKAAIGAAAAFLGATALGVLLVPGGSFEYWSDLVFEDRYQGSNPGFNTSLMGVLTRAGMEQGTVRMAWVLLGMALGAAVFAMAALLMRRGQTLAAICAVGALSVLLAPVSWPHHQFWLVMAAFVGVAAAARRQWIYTIAVLVLMTIPFQAIPALSGSGLGQVLGNIALWPIVESRFLLACCVAVVIPAHLCLKLRTQPAPETANSPQT